MKLKQAKRSNFSSPAQTTPASSPWPQLFTPMGLCVHFMMEASDPVHCTSSSQISFLPSPKKADFLASRTVPQFNSRHTTSALVMLQWSSHTVPQLDSWKISTLPEQREGPTNRILSQSINETLSHHELSNDMEVFNCLKESTYFLKKLTGRR